MIFLRHHKSYMNRETIMYKKYSYLILIAALFINTPAFALYWGVFDDYKENKNEYAVVKFINNTPIKYAITTTDIFNNNTKLKNTNNKDDMFKTQVGSALQQEQQLKTLDNMIIEAFNTWPKDTLAAIQNKNNNRAKEFADITPLLSRQKRINLQKVGKNENPDIIFYFANSYKEIEKLCDAGSRGCYVEQDTYKKINIFNPFRAEANKFVDEKKETMHNLIHEIGHYFALTDQYKNEFDSDLEHSTSDRFRRYDSIMGANYENSLACDDIDGFINVLDLTLSMTKGWSARASKGWDSFCNGKKYYDDTRYVKAKVIKQPIRHYDGTRCFNQFDKNGNFIKATCAPSTDFDFYNKNLTYNKHGLVETKKDGAFTYKYTYEVNKENRKPRIYVNYYLKDAEEFDFHNIYQYNSDKKIWLLSSCELLNDGYDASLFYNKDSIEYRMFSCDGNTRNSYFFDQNGKLFKSEFAFRDEKDNKNSWGIVQEQKPSGQVCSAYIKKNGKREILNTKELNYDKTKLKTFDRICSKSGPKINIIPTVNYFIKVKKYFYIN